jgi:hypothetical protein
MLPAPWCSPHKRPLDKSFTQAAIPPHPAHFFVCQDWVFAAGTHFCKCLVVRSPCPFHVPHEYSIEKCERQYGYESNAYAHSYQYCHQVFIGRRIRALFGKHCKYGEPGKSMKRHAPGEKDELQPHPLRGTCFIPGFNPFLPERLSLTHFCASHKRPFVRAPANERPQAHPSVQRVFEITYPLQIGSRSGEETRSAVNIPWSGL